MVVSEDDGMGGLLLYMKSNKQLARQAKQDRIVLDWHNRLCVQTAFRCLISTVTNVCVRQQKEGACSEDMRFGLGYCNHPLRMSFTQQIPFVYFLKVWRMANTATGKFYDCR